MLRIQNNFFIQCKHCDELVMIEVEDMSCDVYSYDRPMGDEIEYNFYGETYCENCQSIIKCSIIGYEYPVGAFNYSSFNCVGGEFLDEPILNIDYELELDYYDEIYSEYQSVENDIEYQKNKIREMTPREFEFFVADIFKQHGFSVKVTPQTRDGGMDIIATKEAPFPFTLIIECKHWADNHKVDVDVVRKLYGVQVANQINQSIVVTSSKFTKKASEFALARNNLMKLVDIEDLIGIINSGN